ncbi:MAG: pyruvate kinase [Desulfurococcales archaeon]|nr:pyruvate kinase [Desulfurococcales archaeon]
MVKVLATLGPSSIDLVEDLARAGVDGFRINMSHGSRGLWDRMVNLIRDAEERVGRPLAIVADLEGPRVRLGSFTPIQVKPGDVVALGSEGIPVDRDELFKALEPGDNVLVADGKVVLRVLEVWSGGARARVESGRVLEPRKGVAVAGKDLPLPPLTSKDLEDLEFAASRPFSHVMVSYVRDPGHVEKVRDRLRSLGAGHIRVIAKIETPSAVKRVREIARASDGVVVARGDLGMHYLLEELPRVQARIIEGTRAEFRPVILATELLPSMITSPTPARSDVVDVYTGARSGVDAMMLTGETAVGEYPVEAVRWLRRIVGAALQGYRPSRPEARGVEYRLARGIVELVESLEATLVVYSRTGTFPGRISSFRPTRPYKVGVPTRTVARAVSILWGAEPLIVPARDYQDGLDATVRMLEPELEGSVVMAAWSREQDHYHVKIRIDRGAG